MALRIENITSEDIPAIAKIHYDSLLTNLPNQMIYPKGATAALLSRTEKRYTTVLDSDPEARLLKIVDDETGEIIAFAEWHVFETVEQEGRRKDLEKRDPAPDTNQELAAEFWNEIVKARKTMAGKPHCLLHIVVTSPAHMRRGAGRMLVEWGTAEADRLHLPCFLEASPKGRPLYQKCGYEVVDWMTVDLGKYETGAPVYNHAIMLRSAR